MKCKESGCEGEVNLTGESLPMRTGCHSFNEGFPCQKCGRIYWDDGEPVENRQGNGCFLEGDYVIHKDKNGEEVSRACVGR